MSTTPNTVTQQPHASDITDFELPPYPEAPPPSYPNILPPLYPPRVLPPRDFTTLASKTYSEIRTLASSIQGISTLHNEVFTSRSADRQQTYHSLSHLSSETSTRIQTIHDHLRALKADAQETTSPSSFEAKRHQTETLVAGFRSEILRFSREDGSYKHALRRQITRQYLILNPEAAEDEVRRAADRSWSRDEVFRDRLGNRSPQAAAVLGNVAARRDELTRVEGEVEVLSGIYYDLEGFVVVQRVAEEVGVVSEVNEVSGGSDDVDLEAQGNGISEAERRRRGNKLTNALAVLVGLLPIAYGIWLFKTYV